MNDSRARLQAALRTAYAEIPPRYGQGFARAHRAWAFLRELSAQGTLAIPQFVDAALLVGAFHIPVPLGEAMMIAAQEQTPGRWPALAEVMARAKT